MNNYTDRIARLFKVVPKKVQKLSKAPKQARIPTQAFSQFAINREQGDWAEDLLFRAIQELNKGIVAVRYGRTDKILAGEPGFKEFYGKYQEELEKVGKKPDLLIFRAQEYKEAWKHDLSSLSIDASVLSKAIAGLEIRSSAFLVEEYKKATKEAKSVRKRQFLSFTPKVEDLHVIYRWIEKFGVPLYYVQVFFDKIYSISFEKILKILSDKKEKNKSYFIESNSKNQFKSTIHIDIEKGICLAEKVEMPEHKSELKKLQRGRLLFYVTFKGGCAQIDLTALQNLVGLS